MSDDAVDSTVRSEAGPEKRNADVTGLLQPGGVGLAEAGTTLVLDLFDFLHLEMMRCGGAGARATDGRRVGEVER